MSWSNDRPRSHEYGSAWARTRRQWADRHQPDHPCVRCTHPLGPMSSRLHLDHDDHDRSIIRGFSHGAPCPWCGVRCNVSAAARKANAIARANKRRRRQW